MRLYIKRDKTVDNSMFVVFDESCNEKYCVAGTNNSLKVKDEYQNVCLKIRRFNLLKLNIFVINFGDYNIKFVYGDSNNKFICYFHGIGWRIRGDILTGSFDILDTGGSVVATHGRDFAKCGSDFALTIYNQDMELLCLGVAICVDILSKVDNTLLQTV